MNKSSKQPLPYSLFLPHYDACEARNAAASKVLRAIPGIGSGQFGLTPDSVKSSAEYKAAKQETDAAFAQMQTFNRFALRHYKTEHRAEMDKRRDARRAAAKLASNT